MQIQMLFLLLSFAAPENFSEVNKSNHTFTNVYHYGGNIFLTNSDGTRSTIHVGGNSATLANSDGTQSTIDFCGRNSSVLIAIDGTSSSVFHNRSSSTISNPDGTQITVSHMQSTSSCSTENGKHTIRHTFGNINEKEYKNVIDVLIHKNWLIQNKAVEATDEINSQEPQN